jgi:hypothetical protein
MLRALARNTCSGVVSAPIRFGTFIGSLPPGLLMSGAGHESGRIQRPHTNAPTSPRKRDATNYSARDTPGHSHARDSASSDGVGGAWFDKSRGQKAALTPAMGCGFQARLEGVFGALEPAKGVASDGVAT